MDWGGPCQNFVSTEPTPGLSYLYLSAVIDRDLSRESSLPTQFVSDDTTGSRTEQLNQPTSLSAATWAESGDLEALITPKAGRNECEDPTQGGVEDQ